MTLPNFLIIGAAKSGTTALYRYLKQHPEIFMPDRKEPHHFSYDSQTRLTDGPSDYVRSAIIDFSQYQDLFNGAIHETAIGEASPTYIYIPGTAERIYSVLPDVKIIAILRQPAERAFSAYMHMVRDGFEDSKNFSEALLKEPTRIKKNWGPIWHYTKCGYYFEQLERYYRIFNDKNIHVIIYDDFKKNPNLVLKRIFQFLKIEENFSPDMKSKPNVSGIPKNKIIQFIISNLFGRDNLIRDLSRKMFSEELRWQVTGYIRNRNLIRLELPEKVRKQLIDLFRNDILNLQDLLQRDLSIWLE